MPGARHLPSRLSFDDEPTVNSQNGLTWPPQGPTTSGAVRTVISALVASHLPQLDHTS
jgi:hypothetical protein